MLGAFASWGLAQAQDRPGRVLVTELKGAIGVAASMQVCDLIAEGDRTKSEAIVIEIDTPGGLLNATRDLIQCILGAKRPVIVFVAPSGARAASAGTYIAQAAHVAAMAPGTHLGAATPVAMGLPGPGQPTERRPGKEDADKAPPTAQRSAVDQKAINDAVAYLKGLAQLRGRNAEWAERAVREAATLTSEEAVKEKVVDLVAEDLSGLIAELNGRRVKIGGTEIVLATTDAVVERRDPDWRIRLIAAVSDPNIAFILLLVGVYGILFEFWSPGAIVPGVLGGISLLLALTALSVLPVSYGALALLLLGLALMTAEAFAPGFGILGLGGLAAFMLGAIFLFDGSGADFDLRIAWPVIFGAAAGCALLSVATLASVVQARKRPVTTGSEEMIGAAGRVESWRGRKGAIHIHGETWSAECERDCALAVGDPIRVVRREGLTLVVAPIAGE